LSAITCDTDFSEIFAEAGGLLLSVIPQGLLASV
jgi:hypothetical protein